jgi:putative copper export protein
VLAITPYDYLKFLHVSFAIAWVGGGLMLTILAEFALRSKLPGRAAEFAREAGLIGERWPLTWVG